MNFDAYSTFGDIHLTGEALTTQLIDISNHVTLREHAQEWARNLRFLCVPRASASILSRNSVLPLPSETCQHCESWPPFTDKQLDYLWLTNYGELSDCIHYIAVSYCWRQNDHGSLIEKPYDIVTSTGRRKGRAPRSIVDRAIAYARQCGIRLIWIDQECIDQDDRDDKENGIQSMDLVYSRSMYPVGLLNIPFTRQSQIDALAFLIARGENYFREKIHPSYKDTSQSEILQKLEVVELLATDRWFTRTWIFQEATLSSERMLLFAPCEVDLQHPLFGTLAREVMLDSNNIENFSTGGRYFVTDVLSNISSQTGPTLKQRFLQAQQFLDERLSIGFESSCHLSNAVAVICLVERYDNRRVSDRLAIVANLCEYPIRLNTMKLEDKGYGFSTCLLAMALFNGDISFLQFWHETSYFPSRLLASSSSDLILTNENLVWDTFSWAPSHSAAISPCHPLLGEPPVRLVGSSFGPRGLLIQGWLWHIDQQLDLTHIQDRYHRRWAAAVAQSSTKFPRKWDNTGLFLGDFLQSLKENNLADVRDLIVLKLFKSVGWHHYMASSPSTVGKDYIPAPGGGHVVELPDILDPLSSGFESISFEPKPLDFSSVETGDVLQDQILEQILQPSFPFSWYPWMWIIYLIMTDGYLCFGRLVHLRSGVSSSCCGIFEHANAGYYILTPHVHGSSTLPHDVLPDAFEDCPNSWLIRLTDDQQDGVQIVKGRGMVRGLWTIGHTKPERYILS